MRRKRTVFFLVLVIALLLASEGALGHAKAQTPLAGANMVLPFARRSRITQAFGGGHNGTDYRAANGTPVVAAKYGQVSVADDPWPDGTCMRPPPFDPGNYITIDHGGGYVTKYFHLQHNSFAFPTPIPPNPQVYVSPGQRIANSDTTGTTGTPPTYCNPPAAHLHLQFEVNGTPTDPYAGATHWAGADPFPMGYRDQDNAIQGPFRLDDPAIRDKWLTVAAQLGSPIADDCVLAGSCPPAWPGTPACQSAEQLTLYQPTVQRFERGYIYYCSNGVAIAQNYFYTYLPRLQATANASDWDAYVYIRNLSASPATVSITLLKTDGKVLDSRTYQALPANATWVIRPATVINDWLIGGYNTFIGSAVVASDRDVAVVVEHEKSQEVTAYTGISDQNSGSGWGLPGTTLYAPVSMYNPWGLTWKTTLYVQNTTGSQASPTITYCWDNNPTNCLNESDTTPLPPYGSRSYQPNEMGTGFVGSAQVVSDRSLAAVVTQEDNTPRASDYNTFASGATPIWLPSMLRHWPNCGGTPPYSDCWESSFTVQNLGSTAATVTIRYYKNDGSYQERSLPLAAKATRLVVLWDPDYGVPDTIWEGAVWLSANGGQPLVAVANQEREDILTHQSYSSSTGGGTTLYAPFAANSYARGGYTYVSCSHVQNLGSGQTDVTRWYYWWSGGLE
jgi:hypothetical protein